MTEWTMDYKLAFTALAHHILSQTEGGDTGFSSAHAKLVLDALNKLQDRPELVRNTEGRFFEFVGEDVPTVMGQMMALNVEPIYRMDDRSIIGYRVYDDALFPRSKNG